MYSVPEKEEHTGYALDTAAKLLEFYNDFFEIDYPLKKLGQYTHVLARFTQSTHTLFPPPTDQSFLPSLHPPIFSLSLSSDLVAIPDFLAGAMENWGLITFRETSLLVGKQSSPLEKQVVASVIAHELAHQVVCLCVCESSRYSENATVGS